ARADGGVRLRRPRLPDRLDATELVVARTRIRRRSGRGCGFLRRASLRRAAAGTPHSAEREARALVCGERSYHRCVGPGARFAVRSCFGMAVESDRTAAVCRVALAGGVLWDVLAAVAGDRVDGRDVTGNAMCVWVDTGALCGEYVRRGARRAGCGVLARAGVRAGANGDDVRRAQSSVCRACAQVVRRSDAGYGARRAGRGATRSDAVG